MLAELIQHRLNQCTRQDQLRDRYVISHRHGNEIQIDNQSLINFCSNDYLGVTQDTHIKKIFAQSAHHHGLGSGASAQVSGYSQAHRLLEERFANFLHRDQAILFNSGYLANLAVITALANRHSIIIADKHCHASLIDGMLLSRAKYYRYPHQNIFHAGRLLATAQKTKKNLMLVTEGVFSIDGSMSPVAPLAHLADKCDATLIVDDAHGMGWLGNQGGGSCESNRLTQTDVPCLVVPLGKAFGSQGAIVAGSDRVIQALYQFGRTHRYTTALPPAICEAVLGALAIIQSATKRREKLKQLITFFITEAKKRALPLLSDDPTPIKAFLVQSEKIALCIQKNLIKNGYFVGCIRPPTVAHKASCIRLSLNCLHTESQILHCLDQFATVYFACLHQKNNN